MAVVPSWLLLIMLVKVTFYAAGSVRFFSLKIVLKLCSFMLVGNRPGS